MSSSIVVLCCVRRCSKRGRRKYFLGVEENGRMKEVGEKVWALIE